jgi:hypothetical protein
MWTECGVTCTNLSSFDTGSGTNPKMTNWRIEVAAKLPGVVVGAANSPTVTVAGNTVTVTVFWIMPGADATTRQFRSIALVNSAV